MGYVGLFLGLVLVAVAVYRGWNITIAAFFGCIVFIVTGSLDVGESINSFFAAWGSFATSFFGKMVFSAMFAKLYEVSGAGTAIAIGISKLLFREHVSRGLRVALCFAVGIICQFVLVIGGVGPVLGIFMTMPIFFPLMKQAGIPRKYSVPALVAGALSFGNVAAGAPTNGQRHDSQPPGGTAATARSPATLSWPSSFSSSSSSSPSSRSSPWTRARPLSTARASSPWLTRSAPTPSTPCCRWSSCSSSSAC